MAIDENYTQVLFEQILAQNEAIFEAIAPSVKEFPDVRAKVERMLESIRLHQAMLKAHYNDIHGHAQRLKSLEAQIT